MRLKHLILAATFSLTGAIANAGEMISFSSDYSFDDVTFGLESAILDRGLKIDHISHVGEMLNRTAADVGTEVEVYSTADVYSFCSATISRQVMELDPMNIVYCPYTIFVAHINETDEVVVGFNDYPDGDMDIVEDLLNGIVREALDLD
jgi:uncharacterized protein (DUF302 family)